MKTKKLSWLLYRYELFNAAGNLFTIFFGVLFPILMSVLVTKVFLNDVPAVARAQAITGVFISSSMIVPLATLFIGYAANYAQEIEKEVPLRMKLFGFSHRTMLSAKMLANLTFLIGALIIYTIADYLLLDLQVPSLRSALLLIGTLLLTAVFLFMQTHGFATIFKRFGPTYAVTMTLYFVIMIVGGMMGFPTNRMPAFLQSFASILPMTYVSNDFASFWQSGSYDFGPLLRSFAIFGTISLLILLIGFWMDRRKGSKTA